MTQTAGYADAYTMRATDQFRADPVIRAWVEEQLAAGPHPPPPAHGTWARWRGNDLHGWEPCRCDPCRSIVKELRSPDPDRTRNRMLAHAATDHDWRHKALCATHPDRPDPWFPPRGQPTQEAIDICHACEVRPECLAYAMATKPRDGIWGGLSERRRRLLHRYIRRRRLNTP